MMRKIKLVALDLDGTLVNTEKKVPEGNYQVLKQCEKAGIQIVPATGRAVGGIPPMIRELPGASHTPTTAGFPSIFALPITIASFSFDFSLAASTFFS